MTNLEKARLEDFKKILTYQLVTKIHYSFKDNYKLYYTAPSIWQQWMNKEIKYDKRIYKLIIMFNQTALSKHQCMHIFGKDNGHYLPYSALIAQDDSIKVFNHGIICMHEDTRKKANACKSKKRRFGVKKRYQLPFEVIALIFQDKDLLKKVCDAGSDYYTDRQRRLIFTQLNKQKNYHYKRNDELDEEISEQDKINAVLDEFDKAGA